MAKKKVKRSTVDQAIQAGIRIAGPPLKAANLVLNTANFGLKVISSVSSPILSAIKGIDLSSNDNSFFEFSDLFEEDDYVDSGYENDYEGEQDSLDEYGEDFEDEGDFSEEYDEEYDESE